MQKLLIYLACGASLTLTGCSATRDTVGSIGAAIPNALARTPLMYRPDVQQGNVIDQGAVNRLQPGMTKSQVRYVMGTPMINDVLHQDRWDYVYLLREGDGDRKQERLTIFFEDDRLTRMVGDYRPDPAAAALAEEKEQVISVPDYKERKKGIITRALQKVGLKDDEYEDQSSSEEPPPPGPASSPDDLPPSP
ncbi:MAG: outer membrane protein assembly factor BamE [Chromatiales bacterium]|jgi:outer membrane protein assembly factor BamE